MTDNKAGNGKAKGMPQTMERPTIRMDQGEDEMYVLEARELRKSFGEGEAAVEALKGVNLGAKAGEMLAIMGLQVEQSILLPLRRNARETVECET